MTDRTPLHGRPATTGGPVHIREVVAELLAWRGIDRVREPDRRVSLSGLHAGQPTMVAAGSECR